MKIKESSSRKIFVFINTFLLCLIGFVMRCSDDSCTVLLLFRSYGDCPRGRIPALARSSFFL